MLAPRDVILIGPFSCLDQMNHVSVSTATRVLRSAFNREYGRLPRGLRVKGALIESRVPLTRVRVRKCQSEAEA